MSTSTISAPVAARLSVAAAKASRQPGAISARCSAVGTAIRGRGGRTTSGSASRDNGSAASGPDMSSATSRASARSRAKTVTQSRE